MSMIVMMMMMMMIMMMTMMVGVGMVLPCQYGGQTLALRSSQPPINRHSNLAITHRRNPPTSLIVEPLSCPPHPTPVSIPTKSPSPTNSRATPLSYPAASRPRHPNPPPPRKIKK